jgi:hypothetical protein
MPRAKTPEEKRNESIEALAQAQKPPEPTPSADGAVRRKRGVFNGTKGKLSVDTNISGHHLHIMNDDKTRIQDALDNGYVFVKPEEVEGLSDNVVAKNGDLGDSRIRFLVGSRDKGEPMYGYLMKIRQEWYEEDQAELQAKNDKVDAAIRTGKITGSDPMLYVPKDGIKLS